MVVNIIKGCIGYGTCVKTCPTDVLVVGSGMAGLFAAVKAHDAGARVMLISKGRLGSSGQTPFAKGIFAFDKTKSKVSLDEFTDTVSRSALGTTNPRYTRQMAEHSLARVNELREWGFFESHLYNNSFHKPIGERNIPIIERMVVTHLIKENGEIADAAGFSLDELKVYTFRAKSIILCTGAGGFKPNGFPICDLTHDGTIMAYNIGAKVTGKEWNDGHPGKAADLHELRLAHETANMILSAGIKLRASIMRKESRYSHFRLDYPEPDYENWNAWINIYKGEDGNMKL